MPSPRSLARKCLQIITIASFFPLIAGCSPLRALNWTASGRDIKVTENIPYGPLPRQSLDLYVPESAAADLPVVVFFYGGAWQTGTKEEYRFVARALAHKGVIVALADYRLYPDVSFPTFIEDGAKAVAWTAMHAGEFGGDAGAIFLSGHSAGAYIAMMLALDPRYLSAAGYDRRALAGAIGVAGPYDFLPITRKDVIPIFAGAADMRQTQPIAFADNQAPPLLLLTGLADDIVEPDETRRLAKKIGDAGGKVTVKAYPELGHIGILLSFASIFSGKAPVVEDIAAFVHAHHREAALVN